MKQPLLLLILATAAICNGLSAQTATRVSVPTCKIIVNQTTAPVIVTDCDQTEKEFVDWVIPTATGNEGCGSISNIQTAGPAQKSEAHIGQYDITYTFMAVDMAGVKMVQGTPDMSTVKTVQATTTFTLTVLPKDITPPVISPVVSPTLADNKVPNLTSTLTVSDNCTSHAELVITQEPIAGTVITTKTDVKISVQDKAGNTSEVSVSVSPK